MENDEWEDIEDWKLETPDENNGHRFSANFTSNESINAMRRLPNQTNNKNNIVVAGGLNHKPQNPLNHNCISSYNNAYGLNGNLSESSESVPVLPQYQVTTQKSSIIHASESFISDK